MSSHKKPKQNPDAGKRQAAKPVPAPRVSWRQNWQNPVPDFLESPDIEDGTYWFTDDIEEAYRYSQQKSGVSRNSENKTYRFTDSTEEAYRYSQQD